MPETARIRDGLVSEEALHAGRNLSSRDEAVRTCRCLDANIRVACLGSERMVNAGRKDM